MQQQQQPAFNPEQVFQHPQSFQCSTTYPSYSYPPNYAGVQRSQATSENVPDGYNTWDRYRNWQMPHTPVFTQPPPPPPPLPPALPNASGLVYDFESGGVGGDSYPVDWKSIFIPRIDFRYTRMDLIQLVENQLKLGTVSRIDFAPAKDGSGRMAFIHMAKFNTETQTQTIRYTMEKDGSWDLPAEYNLYPIIKLRFVINRRPIPTTEFTMETLADAVNRVVYTQEQQANIMEKRDKALAHSNAIMEQWRATAFTQIQELRDIEMHSHESCKRLHEELEAEKRKSAEHESRMNRLELVVNKQTRELNESKSLLNQTYSTRENLYEKVRRLETELRDVVYKLDSNYIDWVL